MFLLEDIANFLLKNPPKLQVEDLRIGLRYTGAKLSDGSGGIAFSYISDLFVEKNIFLPRVFNEIPIHEILKAIIDSKRTFTSVIGTAVINAISNSRQLKYEHGDIFDFLDLKKTDFAIMIGDIHPLVPKVKDMVKKLLVFERARAPHTPLLPDWMAPKYLIKADVVLFTGASVINRTFDQLIPYAKNARIIAVVGPSTPLYPDFYKTRGVTYIAGVRITNSDRMLDIISAGGGTHDLSKVTEKVVIEV